MDQQSSDSKLKELTATTITMASTMHVNNDQMHINTDLYSASYVSDYSSEVSVLGQSLMLTPVSPEKNFQRRKKSHADVEKVRRQKLKDAFGRLKAELWESPNVASAATRRHTLDYSLQILTQLKSEVYVLEQVNAQMRRNMC